MSERVLKLVKYPTFLEQERTRTQNLTRGIQGFGSFERRSSSSAGLDFPSKIYGRCNSHCSDRENMSSNDTGFDVEDGIRNTQGTFGNMDFERSRKPVKKSSSWSSVNGDDLGLGEDHPFCDKPQTTVSLLSSVE